MACLIIYARISDPTKKDECSTQNQIEHLRAWAANHGHTIADAIDEQMSAAHCHMNDRPGLKEAIRKIDAHEADGILVTKHDRLSRSALQSLTLWENFKNTGKRIICADQGIDSASEDQTTKLWYQFQGVLAEYERDQIVGRLQAGKRAKSALGGITCGQQPIGVKFIKTDIDGKKITVAVVDNESIGIIHKIDELREKRWSYRQIAAELNRLNIKPKRADSWNQVSVRLIVKRRSPHLRSVLQLGGAIA